jgi:hypothetical protein
MTRGITVILSRLTHRVPAISIVEMILSSAGLLLAEIRSPVTRPAAKPKRMRDVCFIYYLPRIRFFRPARGKCRARPPVTPRSCAR